MITNDWKGTSCTLNFHSKRKKPIGAWISEFQCRVYPTDIVWNTRPVEFAVCRIHGFQIFVFHFQKARFLFTYHRYTKLCKILSKTLQSFIIQETKTELWQEGKTQTCEKPSRTFSEHSFLEARSHIWLRWTLFAKHEICFRLVIVTNSL